MSIMGNWNSPRGTTKPPGKSANSIWKFTPNPKEEGKRVLLNEAADLVSTIATLDDLEGPTAKIAGDRFERLYHGQLVLYEGPAVSKAMIDFRDAVLKWQRTGTKPTELLPEERSNIPKPLQFSKKNSDFMRQLALKLSTACKKELEELDKDNAFSKSAKRLDRNKISIN